MPACSTSNTRCGNSLSQIFNSLHMPNLLVTGISGRMGQAVLQAAAEAGVPVTATHDAGQDIEAVIAKATCAIDFTIHSFTTTLVEAALKHGTSLVIGTTGHT
ncbi:MAG: hypothetical protein RLZZ522_1034, partial [Verrucomicrobiota bacterium]